MMDSISNGISSAKRRVSYFYDAEVGNYHYGQGHPMKVKLFFIKFVSLLIANWNAYFVHILASSCKDDS